MQRRAPRRVALRGTVGIAAAAALGLGAVSPALAAPEEEGPTEHTDMGVTGADAMEHLGQLSDISLSHAEDGYRALGTPGYEEASEYVEEVLEATGAYEVERQYFDVEDYTVNDVSFSADGADYEAGSFTNAEPGEVSGAVLTVPEDESYGDGEGAELGCEPGDFTDVEDSIVLVQRGVCDFGLKVTHASEAGAAGVVVINTDDEPLSATLGDRVKSNAPAVWLSQTDGEALREEVLDGAPDEDDEESDEAGITGDLLVDAEFATVETWNVIAETTAGDPDNVEMLGAHLDGVQEGPGVNDNGSGTAALLTVAERLAEQATDVDNTVRFGFWGAEEVGLVGSTQYVAGLSDAEAGVINSYLNFDMVGSENFVVGTLDSDGSDVPIPDDVTVPEGSAELEEIFTDFFDQNDQPHVGTEFSGRSDYKAFMDRGIASSGLFSGADGVKTAEEVELFGGVEGEPYDRYYHTVDDTIENVSTESMEIFLPAIGFAAHSLAYDLRDPGDEPTEDPTDEPTDDPTDGPTDEPSDRPTDDPGDDPDGGQDDGDRDDGRGDDNDRDDNAGDLPRTGADTMPLLTAATILLIGGGALVAATRTRRAV